jgi:multidrug transporter EmrE-like cation transporter
MNIVEVSAIATICLFAGMCLKKWRRIDNDYIPHWLGCFGGILGIIAMFTMEDFPANDILTAFATGIWSGLGSVGLHQALKPIHRANVQTDNTGEN